MLAYAPERRAAGAGQQSRKTLMLVVVGHIALVAVALTTKMTIDIARGEGPLIVENYPLEPPPAPIDPQVTEKPRPATASTVTQADRVIPTNTNNDPVILDPGPSIPAGPEIGDLVGPYQPPVLQPAHDPVRTAAVLRTGEADLRPPYPVDKLRAEEEATLKLRLTIDEMGRVIAVDPVGKADPSFLAAARRHLMRSWRYRPATVDGVATTTSTVISLSFRLQDA